VVLGGVQIEARTDLANGVRLVPWPDLQDSAAKRTVEEWSASAVHVWQRPGAALERVTMVPVRHEMTADPAAPLPDPIDLADLEDAAWCLTVTGPSAPVVIASWVSAEPWVPTFSRRLTLTPPPGVRPLKKLTPEELRRAKLLHEEFVRRPEPEKRRLRVPLKRLHAALLRRSPEDSAIDLGVALEALILHEIGSDKGELTFQLKLRAARLLERDAEHRRETFRLVGQLYGLRSAAVHTGVLPAKASTSEIMERGYALVASALARVILEGEPRWDDVLFS
jgi:hypothetical protein